MNMDIYSGLWADAQASLINELFNSRVGIPIPSYLYPSIIIYRHNLRHAVNIKKIYQVSEIGIPIIYSIINILKPEDEISIDNALGARHSGSDPIMADAILPMLHDVDSECQYPPKYVPYAHFYWLIGLINESIMKFYEFQNMPIYVITLSLCQNIFL